jgi:predicted RNase H-like HicB family nuclease
MTPANHASGYRYRLRREPEGGYPVRCEKFPGVVTYGQTRDAAKINAREAIGLTIEVFREQHRPLPARDVLALPRNEKYRLRRRAAHKQQRRG